MEDIVENKSDRTFDVNLAIRGNAERYKYDVALEVGGTRLTYAELVEAAESVSRVIRGYPYERVAVYGNGGAATYVLILGVFFAERIYVPINHKFPTKRNAYILDSLEGCLLLYPSGFDLEIEEIISHSSKHVSPVGISVKIDDQEVAFESQRVSEVARDETRIQAGYLLFTSGTTGSPKGILVSRANLSSYVFRVLEAFRPGRSDRFSQLFDLTFDLSIHNIFVCWCSGACLCVPTAMEAQFADIYIFERAITWWLSVPSMVRLLHETKRLHARKFGSIRMSMFCGEALPVKYAEAWASACVNSEIVNIYGPTETTVTFTYFQYVSEAFDVLHPDCGLVPIGRPFKGLEALIVDDLGNVISSPGVKGELLLGGAQTANSYWKLDDLTEKCFLTRQYEGMASSSWYRTGDIASWDSAATLHYHGRSGSQIKVGGYRVELLDVQTVLNKLAEAGISFAVVPYGRTECGTVDGLIAFYSGREQSEKHLRTQAKDFLPWYCIPQRFCYMDEGLPINSNGKIDYKRLETVAQEQCKTA